MPFVKLDCRILDKSIWRESAEVCKIWITILAMADANGMVEASIIGISDRARISLPDTESALNKFMGPDPYSTNPENNGRRIERVTGGFQILNYQIYREKDHSTATRQRRHREKLKGVTPLRNVTSASVYASSSEVLSYLNLKTGKKFRDTKHIVARLNDGYTVDQLKQVIDTKCEDRHFVENPHYLNPTTLFRPSHIDNYINQSPNDFKRKCGGSLNVGRNDAVASEPTLAEKIQHKRALIENFEANYKLNPERWGAPLEKLKAELRELEDENK